MTSIMAKGYNLPGEFINPDYSDPKNARPPDYRTTLYWNPFIVTDSNNSTFTIEYFNNDVSKRKILRLVGLTSEGIPIETVSRMLGHTKISTTQIYSKVTTNKIYKDMDKLMKQDK